MLLGICTVFFFKQGSCAKIEKRQYFAQLDAANLKSKLYNAHVRDVPHAGARRIFKIYIPTCTYTLNRYIEKTMFFF